MRRFAYIASIAAILCAPCANAQNASQFYKGKTIRLIVGAAAGGGYDIAARPLASHMGRHIPGNPTVVIQYMPGAASLIMSNYLYARAARDGTDLGMPNNNLPLEPSLKLLSRQGGNVAFDISKFGWIGSPVQDPQVLFARSDVAKTVDDLKRRPVIVGATGTASDNYTLPFMLNQLLGTKMTFVTGYEGQNEIFLAMERHEIEANSAGLSNLFVAKGDWVREGRVNVLVQFGSTRLPSLPNVPTGVELVPDGVVRQMIRLFTLKFQIARPIATPPGVPEDRLRTLQKAFDETMKDDAFIADAKKMGLDIDPVSGPEVTRLVNELQTAPPEVIDGLRKLLAMAP